MFWSVGMWECKCSQRLLRTSCPGISRISASEMMCGRVSKYSGAFAATVSICVCAGESLSFLLTCMLLSLTVQRPKNSIKYLVYVGFLIKFICKYHFLPWTSFYSKIIPPPILHVTEPGDSGDVDEYFKRNHFIVFWLVSLFLWKLVPWKQISAFFTPPKLFHCCGSECRVCYSDERFMCHKLANFC